MCICLTPSCWVTFICSEMSEICAGTVVDCNGDALVLHNEFCPRKSCSIIFCNIRPSISMPSPPPVSFRLLPGFGCTVGYWSIGKYSHYDDTYAKGYPRLSELFSSAIKQTGYRIIYCWWRVYIIVSACYTFLSMIMCYKGFLAVGAKESTQPQHWGVHRHLSKGPLPPLPPLPVPFFWGCVVNGLDSYGIQTWVRARPLLLRPRLRWKKQQKRTTATQRHPRNALGKSNIEYRVNGTR